MAVQERGYAPTSPRLIIIAYHLTPCTFADAPCMGLITAGTSPTCLLYWTHRLCRIQQHWVATLLWYKLTVLQHPPYDSDKRIDIVSVCRID